jgi:hypothetical protein
VEQWADKFRDYLSNENDWLFHSPPADYVIGEYLNEKHPGWMAEVREKKGLEYYPIMYDLKLCIDCGLHPGLRRGVGWEAARRRLERAIKRVQVKRGRPLARARKRVR